MCSTCWLWCESQSFLLVTTFRLTVWKSCFSVVYTVNSCGVFGCRTVFLGTVRLVTSCNCQNVKDSLRESCSVTPMSNTSLLVKQDSKFKKKKKNSSQYYLLTCPFPFLNMFLECAAGVAYNTCSMFLSPAIVNYKITMNNDWSIYWCCLLCCIFIESLVNELIRDGYYRVWVVGLPYW